MSIQLTCPAGHTLRIADAWAGRAGRCPVCKAQVQVPAAPAAAMNIDLPTDSPAGAPAIARDPVQEKVPDTFIPTFIPKPPPLPTAPFVAVEMLSKEAVDSFAAEFGQVSSVERGSSTGRRDPPPLLAAPSPSATTIVEAKAQPVAPDLVASPTAATGVAEATVEPESQTLAGTIAPRARTGYRPDSDKRLTVYYLAAAMGALSVFALAPALPHWDLGSAPDWARAIWLLSLLQLAYVAWVVSIPDWTTLWSSMIVFTIVAALYGLTMTVALTTPQADGVPLDLTDVRRQAVLWCAGVMLLACLVAYCCGRAAWRWRRTFELLHA